MFSPSAKVRENIKVKKIESMNENQSIVYVYNNGKITPIVITKGLSDMTNIEIKEGLNIGDKVIVEAHEPRRR